MSDKWDSSQLAGNRDGEVSSEDDQRMGQAAVEALLFLMGGPIVVVLAMFHVLLGLLADRLGRRSATDQSACRVKRLLSAIGCELLAGSSQRSATCPLAHLLIPCAYVLRRRPPLQYTVTISDPSPFKVMRCHAKWTTETGQNQEAQTSR
jgi:hypothetical protein